MNETATWTIIGHVNFSATGIISEGSCRTPSFAVDHDGGYIAETDSSAFTIPSLNGSGTQACGSHATDLNNLFALGGSGALLHFNKFDIVPL